MQGDQTFGTLRVHGGCDEVTIGAYIQKIEVPRPAVPHDELVRCIECLANRALRRASTSGAKYDQGSAQLDSLC